MKKFYSNCTHNLVELQTQSPYARTHARTHARTLARTHTHTHTHTRVTYLYHKMSHQNQHGRYMYRQHCYIHRSGRCNCWCNSCRIYQMGKLSNTQFNRQKIRREKFPFDIFYTCDCCIGVSEKSPYLQGGN